MIFTYKKLDKYPIISLCLALIPFLVIGIDLLIGTDIAFFYSLTLLLPVLIASIIFGINGLKSKKYKKISIVALTINAVPVALYIYIIIYIIIFMMFL